MAGTVLARQLTPPKAATSVDFAVAEPRHDAAIRRLLRENPMAGAVHLTFEREPSYFDGAGLAGSEEQTILAIAGGRVICMGRSMVRPCWVGGRVQRVGYLSELRLDGTARGRLDILRGGYRFFHQQQAAAPADFYFTSIAADNHRARRLLERGVPGLPAYHFFAEFVTQIIPVRGISDIPWGDVRHRVATPADAAAMVGLLNGHGADHDLAAQWTEARFASLVRHGLPPERWHLLWEDNRLIACAALWDQRAFRQTVVRGYATHLRLARPWLNILAWVMRRVELPPVGTSLPHAFVSPMATAEDRPDILAGLLARMASDARRLGLQMLTLGFEASAPRLAELRGNYRAREYRTRLYQVSWPGSPERRCLAGLRGVMPEIALL